MSEVQREQRVRAWFGAWLNVDPACINEIFAGDAVYSECYGPEYRGRAQIVQWFTDWNATGRVLKWDIKRFVHQGGVTAVEWYFECECSGERGGFDGVTLIDWDEQGRIVQLREFQSKAEHNFPYGEQARKS